MTMTFHLQLGAAENIARRDVVAIRECLGLLQLDATTRRRRHGDDVRLRSFERPQVGIDSVSGIRFRRRREFIGGCRAVVPHVQPVSARNLHRGLPHLQQDWAPLAHIWPKTGLRLLTSAARLEVTRCICRRDCAVSLRLFVSVSLCVSACVSVCLCVRGRVWACVRACDCVCARIHEAPASRAVIAMGGRAHASRACGVAIPSSVRRWSGSRASQPQASFRI
jgi:hypothetical protein